MNLPIAAPATHPRTILLAEDDPATLMLVEDALKSLDYQVATAGDGIEAWETFDRDPRRIIISDWNMPGIDGLEFCRRVRARPSTSYAYFILLTAEDNSPTNYLAAIDAGIDDFLTKPMDKIVLRSRLHVAERILGYTSEISELRKMMPICSYCKKIRQDEDYWEQVEAYVQRATGTLFSHGICPDCYETIALPQLEAFKRRKQHP